MRKTAVITGATQGIGRAIAERLLKEHFAVAVCARSESDIKQLQETLEQSFPGHEIYCFVADLGTREGVLAFAAQALQYLTWVDILVNNAGTFQPGELATEADGQLEAMMQVNLYSAYHLSRALLPVMKQAGRGHIFNLCSIASLRAYPNGGAYSITKYALLGFTENLREELKPHKIKVTALCPGATWSRSWSGSGVPKERIMEAEDIAKMLWAAYDLSPQADVETIVMRPLAGDL